MSDHPGFSEAADGPAGEAVVLVQFDRSGYEEISRADLVLESARAVERAMDTIKSMGERVSVTVDSLGRRPAEVEVSFGIALEAEAGRSSPRRRPAHPSTSRSSGTSGRTPTPGDLQQLRRFAVQILDRRLRKVCGTGAVVSREGHVATCAHVVRYAGIDPSELGWSRRIGAFDTAPDRKRRPSCSSSFVTARTG